MAGNRQRPQSGVSILLQNRSMRRVLGGEHYKQFVQYSPICGSVSLIKELTFQLQRRCAKDIRLREDYS